MAGARWLYKPNQQSGFRKQNTGARKVSHVSCMHCIPMISLLSSRFLFLFFPLQPNSFKASIFTVPFLSSSFKSIQLSLLLLTTPPKLLLWRLMWWLHPAKPSDGFKLNSSLPRQVLSSPVLKDIVLHGFPPSSRSPAASSCQLLNTRVVQCRVPWPLLHLLSPWSQPVSWF